MPKTYIAPMIIRSTVALVAKWKVPPIASASILADISNGSTPVSIALVTIPVTNPTKIDEHKLPMTLKTTQIPEKINLPGYLLNNCLN